jgi:hypothetical protein
MRAVASLYSRDETEAGRRRRRRLLQQEDGKSFNRKMQIGAMCTRRLV